MTGSIRRREARQVVADTLLAEKIPSNLHSFVGNDLHMLVGSRRVTIPVTSKMLFYALQELEFKIRQCAEEIRASRMKRNQVDIEDLLQAGASA